ncbi:hypothetical protein EBT16_02480 [bacterium]|nr:hypothetical protein [bacterium]
MSIMDTAEGWKKLYCIIQSDFALHLMYQRTNEEWNEKLKSIEKSMPKGKGENAKGIPDLVKNPKDMIHFPETSFRNWLAANG